ncbi:MAG: D-alanyl-D-alanine carboxypeptidase [Clostridia bacterium]|nr:D-alanyl-D-alanine carboxypeptidase [Clostridia bacterium]
MKRMRIMHAISTLLCAVVLFTSIPMPAAALSSSKNNGNIDTTALSFAAEEGALSLECKSAVLMDASTGTVLYAQNSDESLPPASVTKIMTLLLVMEAIDSGTLKLSDPISVSANAASMGGSQVYLEEGETMSCEDMLKSVVISSANDAAVALAEHVAGDIDTFVRRMNEKAAALGMQNTHFENATGLDDTAQNHLTSARDIAIMSRALIEHKTILNYSSLWMDSIRNGTFGLTNTNRLVRFYRGATGLKTGSTDKAGFCVSVTAERDGLSLICVIMGAENRDIRNAQATRLLDWGFANYAAYTAPTSTPSPIAVLGGESDQCALQLTPFSCVVPKDQLSQITITQELKESISAPIKAGTAVGRVVYRLGENELGSAPITTSEDVPRVSFLTLWHRLLAGILLR